MQSAAQSSHEPNTSATMRASYLTHMCMQTLSPQLAATELEMPKTTRRLVAKHVGNSVREVAHIIDTPLQPPSDDEVLVKMTHVGINGGCETFRARGEFACVLLPPTHAIVLPGSTYALLAFCCSYNTTFHKYSTSRTTQSAENTNAKFFHTNGNATLTSGTTRNE